MKRLLIIGITTVLMMAPLAASAGVRVLVAPRFGWGWYAPYWAPYPYPYGYYGYALPEGTLKFDTSVKDAEVYINGAYAGTVGQLKSLHLVPGSYDIEVRAAGRSQFEEKVYVVAGKTVHLNPELPLQPQG
ncbi:MAG TPA: PEGA domain-containing protein [Terriglobales bacterium]|nr:PEGA domain-containing protein [Terriglobales bacterium]